MSKREQVDGSEPLCFALKKNEGLAPKRYQVTTTDSLESRCCKIIAANLERYPVEAIGILDEEGWNAVVRKRHAGTAPTKGKGGLDGTGRMAPAMKAQFLAKIEEANPHLAESSVADMLVWKDCVEYKFTAGGVERPNSLKYPWPVLVAETEKAGSALLGLLKHDEITDMDRTVLAQSISVLQRTCMTINLLQSSGVGKLVKRFIKGCSRHNDVASSLGVYSMQTAGANSLSGKARPIQSPLLDLEQLLESWKEMAAQSGTKIVGIKSTSKTQESTSEDTKISEACQTWRSLYFALEQRRTTRLADQGARMRERKRKLDTDRAKIRKVHHAKPNAQHDRILNRPLQQRKSPVSTGIRACSLSNTGKSKVKELKREAAVIISRQGRPFGKVATRPRSSFGNAVAFSTTVLSGASKPATVIVPMNNGKIMKMPAKTVNQNELRTKSNSTKPTFRK